jgi:zinc transporter, ZIP family
VPHSLTARLRGTVGEADFFTVVGIAGAAAVASPLGGMIALWVKPHNAFHVGRTRICERVLLGTVAFSMLPEALWLGSLPIAVGGFSTGFLAMYAFDLFIHRGQLAARKRKSARRSSDSIRKASPRGGEVTVLGGGTSAEELIEGLSTAEMDNAIG